MLSLQVLKCSVKNVVVGRDLLDLSRKPKEDLNPFCIITCQFQLLGFELLVPQVRGSVNVVLSESQIRDQG